MNDFLKPQTQSAGSAVEFDAGLRAYMLKIYNYMASALIITGLVAYFAGTSDAFMGMMITMGETGPKLSPLAYLVMFAPIGMVLFLSARLQSMSESGAQIAFWSFAALMGLSLFYIFAVYTGVSVARVFFITAGTFGAMSLYGYTTKKDLTSWGSFLMMGVFGIFIASIVNIFLHSSAVYFAVSILGVVLFTGLTAYDTQRIRNNYYYFSRSGASMGHAVILGALNLYMDFINLFIMLLNLMGNRR